MSNEAVGWAFKLDLDDQVGKLVLLILADHWREDSDCAWPSVGRVAKISGADERTVQRALTRLIRKKVVKREKRRGTSSIFRLIFDPRQNDVPYLVWPRRNDVSPSVKVSPPVRQNDTQSSHGTSQLNSEKPKLTGREEWEHRLSSYTAGGKWQPFWGPRPDSSGSPNPSIPRDLLTKWRVQNSVVNHG